MGLKSILIFLQMFSSRVLFHDVDTHLCFTNNLNAESYSLIFHFRFDTLRESFDNVDCVRTNDTEISFTEPPLVNASYKWAIQKVNLNMLWEGASVCEPLESFIYYTLNSSPSKSARWDLDMYLIPSTFNALNDSNLFNIETIRMPLNQTQLCIQNTDAMDTISIDTLYFYTENE